MDRRLNMAPLNRVFRLMLVCLAASGCLGATGGPPSTRPASFALDESRIYEAVLEQFATEHGRDTHALAQWFVESYRCADGDRPEPLPDAVRAAAERTGYHVVDPCEPIPDGWSVLALGQIRHTGVRSALVLAGVRTSPRTRPAFSYEVGFEVHAAPDGDGLQVTSSIMSVTAPGQ
jgi:hypothetical protein